MAEFSKGWGRRGLAARDVVVAACCVVVAGSLLASLTGATRSLSQAQVCANNLRQLFTGMTAYVNQYNSYPPDSPYPGYSAGETVNGVSLGGFDPSVGWILTYGLGLVPPRTDTATGHFKWYGTAYADVPDVCKCPAMSQGLLDPINPEVVGKPPHAAPLENTFYQYVVSYQASSTCRAACPVVRARQSQTQPGDGGRNSPIPDPSNGTTSGQQWDNANRGVPGVWVFQHSLGAPPESWSEGGEYFCWIQAVYPSEVQLPGKVYYLADSRDHEVVAGGGGAGSYDGHSSGLGNQIFISARHFGYANAMYLDGRVTRDGQQHNSLYNLDYDPVTRVGRSTQWRCATFGEDYHLANIRRQRPIMPVFMVRGWEAFFNANGMKP